MPSTNTAWSGLASKRISPFSTDPGGVDSSAWPSRRLRPRAASTISGQAAVSEARESSPGGRGDGTTGGREVSAGGREDGGRGDREGSWLGGATRAAEFPGFPP